MAEREPDRFDPLSGDAEPPRSSDPDPGDVPEIPEPDSIGELAGADAEAYTCPNCGMPVDPADVDANGLVQCRICGEQFFLNASAGADDDASEADADAFKALEEKHRTREQLLSDLRIRQVATLRRGLHRTRSYLVVGIASCLAVAANLAWIAFQGARGGQRFRPVGYALFAVALVVLSAILRRRIGPIDAELAVPLLEEPSTPPDFSTLSDGSDRLARWNGWLEARRTGTSAPG